MTNFKNRKGFLLAEAVFATFVVGIIMGPLFISQNNILMHLSSGLAHMQRLYMAKDFLMHTVLQYNQEEKSQNALEKKIEDPAVNMIFTQIALPTPSSLASVKHLEVAQVKFGWEWGNKGFSDVISLIVFKPPKREQS
jgi:hypothetical protein